MKVKKNMKPDQIKFVIPLEVQVCSLLFESVALPIRVVHDHLSHLDALNTTSNTLQVYRSTDDKKEGHQMNRSF